MGPVRTEKSRDKNDKAKEEKLLKLRRDRSNKTEEKDLVSKELEELIKKHSEFSATDLDDDEKKTAFEAAKADIQRKKDLLKTYDNDLELLNSNEAQLMDGVEETGTAASEVKQEDGSLIDPTGEGTDPLNPIEIEDQLDLMRPSETRPTAEMKDPDKYREVIAVKNGQGKKIGIVKYGPANASVFRREDGVFAEGIKDISNPTSRLGEKVEYVHGVKKWAMTRRNVVSIQGIAFPEDCSVKDLSPSRKAGDRYVPTDVFIKWTDGKGNFDKSWETRTTFRRVWGKQGKGPDYAIYEAAKFAESRFNEWKRGERRSASRSPTPAFFKSHALKGKGKEKAERGQSKKKRKVGKRESRKRRNETDDEDSQDDVTDNSSDSEGDSDSEEDNSSDSSSDSSDSDDENISDSDDEGGNKKGHKKRGKKDKGKKSSKSRIVRGQWEMEWAYKRGKDIRKLSKKDLEKMHKDFKRFKS